MKRQHIVALRHPCRFAFEVTHPRYRVVDKELSIILTVNSGYE